MVDACRAREMLTAETAVAVAIRNSNLKAQRRIVNAVNAVQLQDVGLSADAINPLEALSLDHLERVTTKDKISEYYKQQNAKQRVSNDEAVAMSKALEEEARTSGFVTRPPRSNSVPAQNRHNNDNSNNNRNGGSPNNNGYNRRGSFGSRGGRGGYNNNNGGRGSYNNNYNNNNGFRSRPSSAIQGEGDPNVFPYCYYCHQNGHMIRDCPDPGCTKSTRPYQSLQPTAAPFVPQQQLSQQQPSTSTAPQSSTQPKSILKAPGTSAQ